MNDVVYVKLGGSLITDKRAHEHVRGDVLTRLAREIAAARAENPALRLVLGHGSGSFGHVAASKYGTRAGVQNGEGWFGYAVTGDAAARLNRAVTGALLAAEVPAWSVQPGAILRCRDGEIESGDGAVVVDALARGLVPVVYGDVVLDEVRGGTIASTEEIFDWLTGFLPPRRIILTGEVDGIYTADPLRSPHAEQIRVVTPDDLAAIESGLTGSHGVDVTGGMLAKVRQCVELVRRHPRLEINICSGLEADNLLRALRGDREMPGTLIRN